MVSSASQSKQGAAAAELQCVSCGSERVRRIERKGILERRLFKLFGYFPWRCATCRAKFFLKRRSREGDKPKEYVG
jgi:DNA-directed RNA polymerase subunit RPC12/RpoP